jgi:hypothetical protein
MLETRLMLGQGKLGPQDLLFGKMEGKPLRPSAVSSDWGELAEMLKADCCSYLFCYQI